MNKRILVAIVIAVVIAGFNALRGNDRVIANVPAVAEGQSIDQLTQQKRVVSYLQQHQRLPDYYITKKQAREQGWDARNGNLCSVLPGKAIGGDRFSNREGNCPRPAVGYGARRISIINAAGAAPIVCCIPATA